MKKTIKFIGKPFLVGSFFMLGVLAVYAATTLINSVTTQIIDKGDEIGSGWFQEVNDKIISLMNGETTFQNNLSGKVSKNNDNINTISGDVSQNKIEIANIKDSLLGSKFDPGKTCKDILDRGGSHGDGNYWIDPDGDGGVEPFEVYCDMTTDGGGWTRIEYKTDYTKVNDTSLSSPDRKWLSFETKLSESQISAIQSVSSQGKWDYVHQCYHHVCYHHSDGSVWDTPIRFETINNNTYGPDISDNTFYGKNDGCSNNDSTWRTTDFYAEGVDIVIQRIGVADIDGSSEYATLELTKYPAWLR